MNQQVASPPFLVAALAMMATFACSAEDDAEPSSGIYRMSASVEDTDCEAIDESFGVEERQVAVTLSEDGMLNIPAPVLWPPEAVGADQRQLLEPSDRDWTASYSFGCTSQDFFVTSDTDGFELSLTQNWDESMQCDRGSDAPGTCRADLIVDYRLEEVCEDPCSLRGVDDGYRCIC